MTPAAGHAPWRKKLGTLLPPMPRCPDAFLRAQPWRCSFLLGLWTPGGMMQSWCHVASRGCRCRCAKAALCRLALPLPGSVLLLNSQPMLHQPGGAQGA